jgi:hypothetical protein
MRAVHNPRSGCSAFSACLAAIRVISCCKAFLAGWLGRHWFPSFCCLGRFEHFEALSAFSVQLLSKRARFSLFVALFSQPVPAAKLLNGHAILSHGRLEQTHLFGDEMPRVRHRTIVCAPRGLFALVCTEAEVIILHLSV